MKSQPQRLLGAPVVELHTGRYCELEGKAKQVELERLRRAAAAATAAGSRVRAAWMVRRCSSRTWCLRIARRGRAGRRLTSG